MPEMSEIRFDFNPMMADWSADGRASVRSELRKMAHTATGADYDEIQTALRILSDPPGRLLKKNFVEEEDMEAMAMLLKDAAKAIPGGPDTVNDDALKAKSLSWTLLPYNQEEVVARIEETAKSIRARFDTFVVFGIGGSALGPAMLHQALSNLRHNDLPKEKRGGAPRFYVEDNVDPERMVSLLNILDLETTCFNIISKSGSTSETMSQYLIIVDLLKQRFGPAYAEHVVFTTDAAKGNLRKIGVQDGITMFEVPDGVGGRFSEMSPVGLLPAAVLGVDIRSLLAGAAAMDARCASDDYKKNPALFAAGAQYIEMQKGLNIHVMMPYADSLRYMADWYAQLWAESLGKNVNRFGEACAVGQTPVKALGVTDQHSQVQLYTQGPDDKVITFLRVENFRSKITIPVGCEDMPNVNFLCGHTLNELINAEQEATQYALLKAAKPSWTITLPEVTAYTLGQLMQFFQRMTAYAGELLNIDAFNQPGVEEGKDATYALFKRPGFTRKAQEIGALAARDNQYIL